MNFCLTLNRMKEKCRKWNEKGGGLSGLNAKWHHLVWIRNKYLPLTRRQFFLNAVYINLFQFPSSSLWDWGLASSASCRETVFLFLYGRLIAITFGPGFSQRHSWRTRLFFKFFKLIINFPSSPSRVPVFILFVNSLRLLWRARYITAGGISF